MKTLLSVILALVVSTASAGHVKGLSHGGDIGTGGGFIVGAAVGLVAGVAFEHNEWAKANPKLAKLANTYSVVNCGESYNYDMNHLELSKRNDCQIVK